MVMITVFPAAKLIVDEGLNTMVPGSKPMEIGTVVPTILKQVDFAVVVEALLLVVTVTTVTDEVAR